MTLNQISLVYIESKRCHKLLAKVATWSHSCITQILFRQIRIDEDQISMSQYSQNCYMFGQSYSMLPETYDSIQILGENFKELYETLEELNSLSSSVEI